MKNDDIFRGVGVEISLAEREQFLKVKETLTRIGQSEVIQGVKNLYQECHILHKRGRYVIAHFHELMRLDGMPVQLTWDDIAMRNTIVGLLDTWGLVKILDPVRAEHPQLPMSKLTIIKFNDKPNWNLIEQYAIGKPKDYYAETTTNQATAGIRGF